MMDVQLLFPDGLKAEPAMAYQKDELMQELCLKPVLAVMAGDDDAVCQNVCGILLAAKADERIAEYRQDVIRDVIKMPEEPRELYRAVSKALDEQEEYGVRFASGQSISGQFERAKLRAGMLLNALE